VAPEPPCFSRKTQTINSCRIASATACVRLRAISFACAFLKWLRTVSTPRLSAPAISSVVPPSEASFNTDSSLCVKLVRETAGLAISPISSSPRAVAVVASTVFKAKLHPPACRAQSESLCRPNWAPFASPLGGRPRFALSKRRRMAALSLTRRGVCKARRSRRG
jgi:hypothetical protein